MSTNSNSQLDPRTSPSKAVSDKAMAHRNGNVPDAEELRRLDTNLFTANNYRSLSGAGPNVQLDEGHVALLVGKVLDIAGVGGDAQAEVEALVREVVRAAKEA